MIWWFATVAAFVVGFSMGGKQKNEHTDDTEWVDLDDMRKRPRQRILIQTAMREEESLDEHRDDHKQCKNDQKIKESPKE